MYCMWKETQKIGKWTIIVVTGILGLISSCTHTYKDGKEYELKERCVVGRYSEHYSDCGPHIECDSSVIDTFWIRKKPKTIW